MRLNSEKLNGKTQFFDIYANKCYNFEQDKPTFKLKHKFAYVTIIDPYRQNHVY